MFIASHLNLPRAPAERDVPFSYMPLLTERIANETKS